MKCFQYLTDKLNIDGKHFFSPRYNEEKYNLSTNSSKPIALGLPMVCFTDEVFQNNGNSSYGRYAILLKKNWALKLTGLSPINYITSESDYNKNISNLYDAIFCPTTALLPDAEEQLQNILIFLLKYIKPYKDENKTYYNEREWRFIPQKWKSYLINSSFFEKRNEESLRVKNELISSDEDNHIKFCNDDIYKIYVENEVEKNFLIDCKSINCNIILINKSA